MNVKCKKDLNKCLGTGEVKSLIFPKKKIITLYK